MEFAVQMLSVFVGTVLIGVAIAAIVFVIDSFL